MADYTKGRWAVDLSSPGDIIAGDGELIASAFPMDSGLEQERNANARLIAAAPDLFEALKNCVNGLGCQPGYVNTLALSIARAAIAAAEGAPDA